jgi:hypothetical protein
VRAVPAEGRDAGLDDLGVPVEGEIPRPAEVEDLPAVEDGFRARGAFHDPASRRRCGLAEGRLVVGEEAAERLVEQDQAGQGFGQEFAPPGHFCGSFNRCSFRLHGGPP